jgi:hypothetical protein
MDWSGTGKAGSSAEDRCGAIDIVGHNIWLIVAYIFWAPFVFRSSVFVRSGHNRQSRTNIGSSAVNGNIAVILWRRRWCRRWILKQLHQRRWWRRWKKQHRRGKRRHSKSDAFDESGAVEWSRTTDKSGDVEGIGTIDGTRNMYYLVKMSTAISSTYWSKWAPQYCCTVVKMSNMVIKS